MLAEFFFVVLPEKEGPPHSAAGSALAGAEISVVRITAKGIPIVRADPKNQKVDRCTGAKIQARKRRFASRLASKRGERDAAVRFRRS